MKTLCNNFPNNASIKIVFCRFQQDDLCSGELLSWTMKEKDLHVQ